MLVTFANWYRRNMVPQPMRCAEGAKSLRPAMAVAFGGGCRHLRDSSAPLRRWPCCCRLSFSAAGGAAAASGVAAARARCPPGQALNHTALFGSMFCCSCLVATPPSGPGGLAQLRAARLLDMTPSSVSFHRQFALPFSVAGSLAPLAGAKHMLLPAIPCPSQAKGRPPCGVF